MKVRYRNDLYGNYMMIEVPDNKKSSQYAFKMLEKNNIPGILACKERMEDGKSFWYVDISKKKNLIQEYQDKEMQLEDMIAIFQKITPILEELRIYLLNESMAVMDPEYIYKDLENDNLYILILPWNSEEKTLHKLAEFFLEKISHKDENGVNAAYLFYRQQSQSNFSWYHFLPVLEKESILKRQKVKESKNFLLENKDSHTESWKNIEEKEFEKAAFSGFDEQEFIIDYRQKSNKKVCCVILILAIALLIFSFLPIINKILKLSCIALSLLLFIVFLFFILLKENKKEIIKNNEKNEEYPIQEIDIGGKETVFFDSYENDTHLKLQWKEKGRKKQFILNEFPCTVGKMKEEVSMVISDLSVSRVHCRFVEKEEKIYIMDLNSTNGTFLNGLPIKNGEILEIEKNDEILIGKVKVCVV